MTQHHYEAVACECGHKGEVHWKENDAPFTKQYEEYSIRGFDAKGYYTDGFCTTSEALKHMNPKCPKCGESGKVKTI